LKKEAKVNFQQMAEPNGNDGSIRNDNDKIWNDWDTCTEERDYKGKKKEFANERLNWEKNTFYR
jgi:hypothetical protein